MNKINQRLSQGKISKEEDPNHMRASGEWLGSCFFQVSCFGKSVAIKRLTLSKIFAQFYWVFS